MKNKTIAEKSKEIELDKRVKNYLYLIETIKTWNLLLNMEENIIINLMNDLNLHKIDKINLVNETIVNDINFIDLYKLFSEDTNNIIGGSLHLKIDIDKSLDTMKFHHNQPQPIIKAFESKLDRILKVNKQTLVVSDNE